MANIRRATGADVGAILAMARDMHAESPRYRGLDFDEEKLFNLAQHLMHTPKAGGVLVAEVEGAVVGMFAFHVDQYFFGHDAFASDVVMYIAPKHRCGSLFPRMVAAFEKWADEFGVKEKLLGVSAGIDTGRAVAVLERLGYVQCATGLMKKA